MKIRHSVVFVLLAGILLFVFSALATVHAATITVDTLVDENDGSCTDGDCSLRDAIATSVAGDTIDFGVTGVITLTLGELAIDHDLTISGPGANSLTISGNNASRVLKIMNDVHATLADITIAHGKSDYGGGVYHIGATLTISNCTFSGNDSIQTGGGIANYGSILNVSNTVFSNNDAGKGGGISNAGGRTLAVTGSNFSGNRANPGGGIYNFGGTVTVTDSSFSGNGYSGARGSGIENQNGTLNVSDSTFSANNGGGIYNSGTLIVVNSDFFGSKNGGISNGTVGSGTVINSTFSNNVGFTGGGIYNIGSLTVTNCTFQGNTAGNNGGGITNAGSLTVTKSTFEGNTAQWGGGIENFEELTVSHSTFYSNTATDTGGGICTHNTVVVTNSTFYSNTAGTRGGGINNNEGSVFVTNSTFFGNLASDGGGIYNGESATLVNTIVANTLAGGDCGGGALDAASTNNLGTDTTCSPGFTQTTSTALSLNWQGWIFEVISDSVAIDAGTNTGCPATDQLGYSRPRDGDGDGIALCDVGSHEFSRIAVRIYLPLVLRQHVP